MHALAVRFALWAHTLVMGCAGLALFLLPRDIATLWPWTLPPLAARFMAALFLAGAICSLQCLFQRDARTLFVMVLLAVGDALIVLAGLLSLDEIGHTPRTVGLLAFFAIVAAALAFLLLPAARAATNAAGTPISRAMRVFFALHVLVVLPTGAAMMFLPGWAQTRWAWQMTPVNVRLIGSFFLGAAIVSAWVLRERFVESVRPVFVLYGTFSTLATIASILHLNLFDSERPVVWAFFGLYLGVASAAWILFFRTRPLARHPARP